MDDKSDEINDEASEDEIEAEESDKEAIEETEEVGSAAGIDEEAITSTSATTGAMFATATML